MRRAWLWKVTVSGAAVVALAGTAVAGCAEGRGPAAVLPPLPAAARLDPAAFVHPVDNPYFPLEPGMRWHYEGISDEGPQTVDVTVTTEARQIVGVTTVVVRDTVRQNGQVIEDTVDWFAADREGNVWYFGEATTDFENGKPTGIAGSWEAGVDGAEAGVVMPARPQFGQVYRQEYYRGEAEDAARVLDVAAQLPLRTGPTRDGLKTEDFTPLEPDVVEHKYYVRGVGLVLAEHVRGGSERIELVSMARA